MNCTDCLCFSEFYVHFNYIINYIKLPTQFIYKNPYRIAEG